jgi:asparagine synthase (glutamine-hydrolysing)
MAGRLPAAALQGRKLGFNVPMAGWLAGELHDFAHDVLSPGRLRRQGLLDPRAVGRLLEEHATRRADRSHALWALLVLVVWHDEVFTGVRRPAAATAAAEARAL